MIQELINAFNGSKGATFVAFEYTNRYGEKASRLIQINTKYQNAVQKDLDEVIPNVEFEEDNGFDRATFVLAQAELIKSAKNSLGIDDGTVSKVEQENYANRSNGQKNAYVQIAKNIKFNIEKQQLMIFAKEVRKAIITEGNYPTVNSRPKTLAKRFIQKKMKSTKYRNYVITNIEEIKVNGNTIELG